MPNVCVWVIHSTLPYLAYLHICLWLLLVFLFLSVCRGNVAEVFDTATQQKMHQCPVNSPGFCKPCVLQSQGWVRGTLHRCRANWLHITLQFVCLWIYPILFGCVILNESAILCSAAIRWMLVKEYYKQSWLRIHMSLHLSCTLLEVCMRGLLVLVGLF